MPDPADSSIAKDQPRTPHLGHLEVEILRVLWGKGESSVRDVLHHLARPLAYTTVMTTLDRLFKKGLIGRHRPDRSFRYLPAAQHPPVSTAPHTAHSRTPRELLISHLVDTVCQYDETLLAELEQNIAERRKQYERRRNGA